MHGLKTIREMNAPGIAEGALAKAMKKWDGVSPLKEAMLANLSTRKAEREAAIEILASASVEELEAQVKKLGCPTVLEEAMIIKLARLREAVTIVDPAYLG